MNGKDEFKQECTNMIDGLHEDVLSLKTELSKANVLVRMYRELSEKLMLEIDSRRLWHKEAMGGGND